MSEMTIDKIAILYMDATPEKSCANCVYVENMICELNDLKTRADKRCGMWLKGHNK